MDIDWSKAPEGATHYLPAARVWYRQTDRAFEWHSGWRLIGNDLGEFQWSSGLAERPEPAWSGEGLPPVGTVCRVFPHNTLWGFGSTAGHEREVLAYHDDFVWLGSEGRALETTRTDKVDFKPLRTPEQTAAEERDAEIGELADLLLFFGELKGAPHSTATFRRAAEFVIASGYRKPGCHADGREELLQALREIRTNFAGYLVSDSCPAERALKELFAEIRRMDSIARAAIAQVKGGDV